MAPEGDCTAADGRKQKAGRGRHSLLLCLRRPFLQPGVTSEDPIHHGGEVKALDLRIGMGYDVHALQKDRLLVLGGVEIPFSLGLEGHSDADVLLHAIMDALLGAAALGDLGTHFPPTDERYQGISSIILLESVQQLLQENAYRVVNLDSTVVAQRPRLFPYLDEMRANIARTLRLGKAVVSVKATTTEHLGFAGRGEGIAAYAVALLQR